MGTKNHPGDYDCYENAEPDEPMFVLLARDPSAPHMVDIWANMREATDGPTPQVLEARQCAKAMREWRKQHRPNQTLADPRIVHGANCIWWDSIDKVSIKNALSTGLPCCSHCGGMLFEQPTEEAWWTGVDRYEQNGHPGYRKFIEWLRGKCFKTVEQARAAYDAERS